MSITQTQEVNIAPGTPQEVTFSQKAQYFLISNRSYNPIFLHLPVAGGGFDTVPILINGSEVDRIIRVPVEKIRLTVNKTAKCTVTAVLGASQASLPASVHGQLGKVGEFDFKQWFCSINGVAATGRQRFSKLGYTEQTVAKQMSVKSDNVNDAAAGTGARIVVIDYIDENWNAAIEEITLNGTTAVATQATNILHINGFFIKTVGSGGKSAGQITIHEGDDGTGTVVDGILAGLGWAHTVHYYVPNGKTLILDAWEILSSVFNTPFIFQSTVELFPGFPIFSDVVETVSALAPVDINNFSSKINAQGKFVVDWAPTSTGTKGAILIRGWLKDAAA